MRRPFNGNWTLTQGFGENPNSYASFGMRGHNGLDYGMPTGTPILAPHSGKIVETTGDPTGYGNYIKIENDKEGSVLAHLSKFEVGLGSTVTEGQQIGLSGNTGNSTGPHLHWGYYKIPRNRQNGYAGFIDQAPLLPPRGQTTTPSNPTTPPSTNDRDERNKNWNWLNQVVTATGILLDGNNPQKSVDEAIAQIKKVQKEADDNRKDRDKWFVELQSAKERIKTLEAQGSKSCLEDLRKIKDIIVKANV